MIQEGFKVKNIVPFQKIQYSITLIEPEFKMNQNNITSKRMYLDLFQKIIFITD